MLPKTSQELSLCLVAFIALGWILFLALKIIRMFFKARAGKAMKEKLPTFRRRCVGCRKERNKDFRFKTFMRRSLCWECYDRRQQVAAITEHLSKL